MDGSKITTGFSHIGAALAAAQTQMGPALKDANNPAFKTKYADLSSVMAACLPALNSHGIAVIQPTFDDDAGRWVKTILIHGETSETLECRVPLIVSKNDMQGYGSAVTYGRRYGLMCMAGIAPEDDDGNAAVVAAPKVDTAAFEAQVAQAIKAIAREATLESLGAYWSDMNRHEPKIVADARVFKAKEDRKAALIPRRDDLGGDEVPY